ncbi:MAG TPA: YciI family protein [Pedobacter sp.]|uniref:YciI family protein n=1 Tax=Pedobacter sp. TaxID=1411316 RepID=UPI002BB901BF|nr:YciI family protein [Pedobacter sp.]HMI03673.1 YciI family protein [Pedobacter sp.]
MKEFLLVFRNDPDAVQTLSPEELQARIKKWMDWVGGIAAQNKLVDRGNRLANEGAVIKPGNIVTDGPFVEIKESIGGYTHIRAESLEEAIELSKGCPILEFSGNVEVRPINPM